MCIRDRVSDTLAFPADNITIENKVILGDIAMCASKINSDSELTVAAWHDLNTDSETISEVGRILKTHY